MSESRWNARRAAGMSVALISFVALLASASPALAGTASVEGTAPTKTLRFDEGNPPVGEQNGIWVTYGATCSGFCGGATAYQMGDFGAAPGGAPPPLVRGPGCVNGTGFPGFSSLPYVNCPDGTPPQISTILINLGPQDDWTTLPGNDDTRAGATAPCGSNTAFVGTTPPAIVSGKVFAGEGTDFVGGGDRPDEIHGGSDSDFMEGDGGGDTFVEGDASNGADQMIGGIGSDTVDYSGRAEPVAVTLGAPTQMATACGATQQGVAPNAGEAGEADGVDVENLIGGEAGDTLAAPAAGLGAASDPATQANILNGGPGNDKLDIRDGGTPQDTAICGTGEDTVITDALGVDDVTDPACERIDYPGAPETTIDSGPSGTVNTADVSFSFSSNEPGSTFECKLNAAPFAACSSPKDYPGLPDGSYTFQVRATDAGGNVDPTPASQAFTVDTGAPPGSCTISGTPGDDKLTGTDGPDVICGGDGNDSLFGLNGADTLVGGDGNDTLNGGKGADIFDGGLGSDTANFANDKATTGAVADVGSLGASDDGTGFADAFVASAGVSTVENLRGTDFADSLSGDAQGNRLQGALGGDTLAGAGGNDVLVGDQGPDSLSGGGDNDQLEPGPGDDPTVDGGADFDTLSYQLITGGGVLVDVDGGTVLGAAGSDTITIFERVVGTPQNDSLSAQFPSPGTDVKSQLFGIGGNDALNVQDGRGGDTADGDGGTNTCSYDSQDPHPGCP